MEIGLEQKKRDGAAMYIKGKFEFRNKKAFTDDKFVRGGTGKQNLKVIKRSSMTGIIEMLEDTSQLRNATFFTCKSRNTQVFRNSCVQMTDRLAHIRRGTASTLKILHHTRF